MIARHHREERAQTADDDFGNVKGLHLRHEAADLGNQFGFAAALGQRERRLQRGMKTVAARIGRQAGERLGIETVDGRLLRARAGKGIAPKPALGGKGQEGRRRAGVK